MKKRVFQGDGQTEFIYTVKKPDGTLDDISDLTSADLVFNHAEEGTVVLKSGVTIDVPNSIVKGFLEGSDISTDIARGVWYWQPILKAGGSSWRCDERHFHVLKSLAIS